MFLHLFVLFFVLPLLRFLRNTFVLYSTLLNNPALKRLELDYCSVNDYSCISGTESLLIVGDRNIRLARISGKENIKNLTIQKSIVRDFSSITEFTNLETLCLEDARGDSNSALEYIKNRNVKVEVKDEYKPMR